MSLTISQLLAAAEDATIGKSSVATRLADAKQRLEDLLASVEAMESELSIADKAMDEAFDGLEQAGIDREASRKVVAGRVAELVALGVVSMQPSETAVASEPEKPAPLTAKARRAAAAKPDKSDPIVAAAVVVKEPVAQVQEEPEVVEPATPEVVSDPVAEPYPEEPEPIAQVEDAVVSVSTDTELPVSPVDKDYPPFLQAATSDEGGSPSLPDFLSGEDEGDTVVWEDDGDVVEEVEVDEAAPEPVVGTALALVSELEVGISEDTVASTTAIRRPSFKPGARANRPAAVASQVTADAVADILPESVLPAKDVFGIEDAPLDDDDSDLPPFMRKQV